VVLSLLEKNSRKSFVNIAKELGVTETAIRKKIKKMEEKGIIKKYSIELNLKKLGFEVEALIGVDTKPENFISSLEKLKKMNEAKSVYSSSGDHMILIHCWFKNSTELNQFIKKIESMQGITKICPAIIIEKIK
jgi:Lrp/AsnC family transcriptional regulator for asnA, asnC and gidA